MKGFTERVRFNIVMTTKDNNGWLLWEAAQPLKIKYEDQT